MAAKGSGQQRKLGAIEPEVVTSRAIANRVVDRMVPSDPSDFDGWTGGDVTRWLTVQAESFREVRRWIGLALLVLRERSTEKVYMAEVKRIATAYDVHPGTLWRWRYQAEQTFGLARVSRATADQDVPSDDTQPGEDQSPDGPDPQGSAELVSSDSPRAPGAGSTRGAEPPTARDGGAVPDQSPGGVTLAEADLRTPQEPPPPTEIRPSESDVSDPSPPVADVLGTGSPPPERTTPGGPAMLDRIAVTPVEEIRGWGAVRVRDAVDRLAAADGRRLVTLAEWADLRAELRRLREAPTSPSKATSVGKAATVTPSARATRKAAPAASPTGACAHPPARWNRLAYGVFCGVPGCGVKVR